MAYKAPMAPGYQGTKSSWKQNPCNNKMSNHWSLLHIIYSFLAVLKGGSKSVHILEEESLKEFIMWLQKFIPPPTCFLIEWVTLKYWNNKSSSHSLILAKHLNLMAYRHASLDLCMGIFLRALRAFRKSAIHLFSYT
jgi:hypothetical protein